MAASNPPPYDLVGGRLCLDFCNTSTDHGIREERFESFTDVVEWAWSAGVLNSEEADRLRRLCDREPDDALRVFERAHRLRRALSGLFSDAIAGSRIRPSTVGVLNDELAGALTRSKVLLRDRGFRWLFAENGHAFDCVLWPVARSAADLLTEGPLDAVRRCEGRDCDWLFLDTSRNSTRRWCDMRICGNRAKARRHHERRREGAA